MKYEYKFILDEKGNPVVEPDVLKWGKWFEESKNRVVARTQVGNYDVSTVFLAMDYSFSETDKPVLWETMVFSRRASTMKLLGHKRKFHKSFDDYFGRYISKEDALKGHEEIVSAMEKQFKRKRK